ncbi:DUF3396 domain-containing protein [Paraburkholderia sp. Ac-20336]|nr:DUF3396 domain-containing protein [Paraburkholderia sp. Ac-20336]
MNSSHKKPVLTPAEAFSRYGEELCQHDNRGGGLVIFPGVIGTVFFERGSKPDVRRGLLACFDRFEQLFGPYLKGGRNGDDGRFSRKTPRGVEAIRRAILEVPPEVKLEVVRSSAIDEDSAAAYQIETLTDVAVAEDYTDPSGFFVKKGQDCGLSYLKFWMPMDFVNTPEGVRSYEAFLRFVCEQLPVRGGYGGFSSILPYSFHEYMPQEWALAQRFSGLEIDSYAFLQKQEYDTMSYEGQSTDHMTAIYEDLRPGAKVGHYGFIKGVNWYTLIGDLLVDRLGGESAVRADLARPDIGIERIGHCLLIRAGDFPRLGAPEEGLPKPYVFVNRVLRVLRNPVPPSLHTNVPGAEHADPDGTRRWEARFDLPGAPLLPRTPEIVPAKKNDPAN